MTLKHVLKHFSKTEVQEDERFSLAPMREREELLCERSELSNSGEGYISCAEHTVTVFSPFTSHFSQVCLPSPDATRHPLPREGRKVSCAKHTVKNLFTYLPIHLFTSKKVAFTLAEVLITLAIIGVVAALTLPALIQKYQMKSFEVAFKKEYSVIQNAIDYLTLENSISECAFDGIKNGYTSVTDDCEALYNGLISQLKLSKINKNFSYAKQADVFANGGQAIHTGVTYDFFQQRANIYTLPDGATLAFFISDGANFFHQICMVLDVNGLKGPNKWGYDAFFMTLVKHNNKILLTDEYASIIEKGGKYPRTILRNQDNNSPTNGWEW